MILEWFSTFYALGTYWWLNSVTLSTFHDQLNPAALTVIPEESGLSALWTVDGQRKAAVVASCPAKLDGGSALWTSGFQRVHFAAHWADV
jgi:hypothetical protein